MGSNRLTRDEILLRSLDLIDSPSLDQKSRPGGVLDPQSVLIGWLQDGLDYFHRKFPWTGLITRTALTLSGTDTYALPADFVLDLRDGLRIMEPNGTAQATKARLHRKSLPWLLGQDTTVDAVGQPSAYVLLPPNLRIHPHPVRSYAAELWYYALPALLLADTIPNFPDDWTLVEFVRLRGKEWTGESAPGAALAFASALCADLQKSGLGTEADADSLPLDSTVFRPTGSIDAGRWGWMGDATVR
jgi:hypothetical protein